MSWSGFKKNVGRATTQVMMKTGHVEKTSDREYEVEERRYRTLESASLRLQKEAKGYLDSLRAMTASQMRIAETIDAFYGDSGARDGVSRSYKQAVEDLDAETVKALDGPYRCVTQDPTILKMVQFDEEKGLYGHEVLAEIEADLNFTNCNRRIYTIGMREKCTGAQELIESIYRTTVLEPINRFCAYFPDINECIKKRNHKMLDYDSMRAKVKKLVEKPDKDPSKLPRTEKEAEMVMDASTFFRSSNLFQDLDSSSTTSNLDFPSPPKVLDGLRRNPGLDRLRADEEAAMQSVGIRRNEGILNRVTRVSSLVKKSWTNSTSTDDSNGSVGLMLPLPNASLCSKSSRAPTPRSGPNIPAVHEDVPGPLASPTRLTSRNIATSRELKADGSPTRHTSVPLSSGPGTRMATSRSFTSTPRKPKKHLPDKSSPCSSASSERTVTPTLWKRSSETKRPKIRVTPTPFFNPSELADIMQPLKARFIEEQADELAQAKAAYEQMNQQLTDELPQLIDLRVPYLDPSFEALVKIQLRFCAEAYSRMAQVQQYLDASTRDQYASGDLDARVEDVLGQIRELSIAGTV